MRALNDVEVGDWIKPRLRGWGVVGGVVPRGYEAYARILHPGSFSRLVGRDDEGRLMVDERPSRWAEVAELSSTVLHPTAQWVALAGTADQIPLGGDRYLNPPRQGQMPLSDWSTLAGALLQLDAAIEVVVGVWCGWGELRTSGGSIALLMPAGTSRKDRKQAQVQAERELAARSASDIQRLADTGPWLELPGREYVLLTGELTELTDPAWAQAAGLGWSSNTLPSMTLAPNLLWPRHAGWFAGTEIDFDSTLLGGTRELIDAVLNSPDLEALEVSEDTDLTDTGDHINHLPAG